MIGIGSKIEVDLQDGRLYTRPRRIAQQKQVFHALGSLSVFVMYSAEIGAEQELFLLGIKVMILAENGQIEKRCVHPCIFPIENAHAAIIEKVAPDKIIMTKDL